MSVVPPPMSTTTTPRSCSSAVSTARLEASGCSTRSFTWRPAREQLLTMFWIDGDRAADDVHLDVQPHPGHAERVLDPVLVVDDELLGQHMEHLLVHGDVDGPGAVDGARHVGLAHFLVLDRRHAAGVEALDMAAGNADIDRVDLHAGHELGLLHGFLDGLDGAVDVHDHAFFQAVGGADADPDDVHLSVVLHLAHDGADLGRPQVEPYQHIIRFFTTAHLRQHKFELLSSNGTRS